MLASKAAARRHSSEITRRHLFEELAETHLGICLFSFRHCVDGTRRLLLKSIVTETDGVCSLVAPLTPRRAPAARIMSSSCQANKPMYENKCLYEIMALYALYTYKLASAARKCIIRKLSQHRAPKTSIIDSRWRPSRAHAQCMSAYQTCAA